jgi:ribosomal protein S18 acetylase RimI-like enzyme
VGVVEPFELPPVVDEIPASASSVDDTNGDAVWMLSPRQNNAALAVNRLLAEGASVARLTTGSGAWSAGTFLVSGTERARVEDVSAETGVPIVGAGAPPSGPTAPLRAPRIALYRGHVSNMPEGWTRWVFDQYGFGFTNVGNDDIQGGALDDFDVLVLPDQEADEILNGHEPGTMPPEYVGGVGSDGVAAIRGFVESGGMLLALDHGIDFAIEHLGLPVRNTVAGVQSQDFFIPGSLLHLDVDPEYPLAWGMPDRAIAFFVRSQAMELTAQAPGGSVGEPEVYARYADDPLASGWALGAAEYVGGRPAAVRIPVGEGSVVLIAFEPQFRGQPHNTFKLLFDPLYAAGSDGLAMPLSTTFER